MAGNVIGKKVAIPLKSWSSVLLQLWCGPGHDSVEILFFVSIVPNSLENG